jgi:hypothetical protein
MPAALRRLLPANAAIEMYAEAFDAAGALDRLKPSPASTAPISTAAQHRQHHLVGRAGRRR